MAQDVALGPLGSSIDATEIDSGAVTLDKLHADVKPILILIEKKTLSGDSSANFTSIPNYKKLVLVFNLRNAPGGALADPLNLQMNGDTGNNYHTEYMTGNGSSVYATSQPAIIICKQNRAAAECNSTTGELHISNRLQALSGATSTIVSGFGCGWVSKFRWGHWQNNAVITSLNLSSPTDVYTGTVSLYYDLGAE